MIGRMRRRSRRLPPVEQPPEGMITPAGIYAPYYGKWAPMQLQTQQAAARMSDPRWGSFRQLDQGQDYDLAARTKAARERKMAGAKRDGV